MDFEDEDYEDVCDEYGGEADVARLQRAMDVLRDVVFEMCDHDFPDCFQHRIALLFAATSKIVLMADEPDVSHVPDDAKDRAINAVIRCAVLQVEKFAAEFFGDTLPKASSN